MTDAAYSRLHAERLPLLDAMRGLAAIAVLLYHANDKFGGMDVFSRGYLFVDFFFLLSGFVLGLAAEPRLRAGLGPAAFMVLRWKRLWPMIFVGTMLGAAPLLLANTPMQVILCVVFGLMILPVPFVHGNPWLVNGVFWSLAMEIIANLAHSLLLWWISTRSLVLIAMVSGLGLTVQITYQGMNNFTADAFSWPLAFLRIAFAYTLGLIIARGHKTRMRKRQRCINWWGPVLLISLCVFGLPFLPLVPAAGDALVTLIGLPLALFWATLAQVPDRFHSNFAMLGAISYPLYTVHIPILTLVEGWRADNLGMTIATLASLAGAFVLAKFVEARRDSQPAAIRVAKATA